MIRSCQLYTLTSQGYQHFYWGFKWIYIWILTQKSILLFYCYLCLSRNSPHCTNFVLFGGLFNHNFGRFHPHSSYKIAGKFVPWNQFLTQWSSGRQYKPSILIRFKRSIFMAIFGTLYNYLEPIGRYFDFLILFVKKDIYLTLIVQMNIAIRRRLYQRVAYWAQPFSIQRLDFCLCLCCVLILRFGLFLS